MLVSFQLASKHPDGLAALLDNLESLAKDPSCFEVLVKVDTEDAVIRAMVSEESAKRKCTIRPLVTPRGRGYEDLWVALNDLFARTDPTSYFVCNINDEVRINEHHWDENLRRYIGMFPDDIFRLRTSKLKLRNYYDFWECGFAPENYAFFTKRWLDISGGWGPCFGPDSSQQYIAYYLGHATFPGIKQFNRDVPVFDLSWRGEGVSKNLSRDEMIRRTATNYRLWMRQVSHPMQQELYRRARILQAHIIQSECADSCGVEITDEPHNRTIVLRDAADGVLLDLLPYKIDPLDLALRNLYRKINYNYYAGGGKESANIVPFNIIEYLIHRFPSFRRFVRGCFVPARALASLLRFALRPLRRLVPRMSAIEQAALDAKAAVADLTSTIPGRPASPTYTAIRLAALPARIALRVLRPVYRGLKMVRFVAAGVYDPGIWLWLSRRTAAAIRDRDLRWFKVAASAQQRLRPAYDPWFSPPSDPEQACLEGKHASAEKPTATR